MKTDNKVTAKQVIEIAASQIGYTESPPNSNMTKFGKEFGWNGVAWCVIFLWWCFHELQADEMFCGGERVAGVWTEMDYAQRYGRWVTGDYRAGDLVIFDFERDGLIDHTGIIESVGESGIVTIEGNTSSYGSQDNGGAVLRKNRPYSVVYGAYRPKYVEDDTEPDTPDDGDDTEEEFELTLKMIRKGDSGSEVKAMQLLLIGYGYSCGNYGADGICGVMTDNAIRAYQRAKGLEQDGICGPITWASLLGVHV